jgi:hypothetical protein
MSDRTFIDGTEVQEIWSTENDPLFDAADAGANVYRDAGGQHYLMVEHWGGGRHVLRISSSESDRIVASDNYRLVFWRYQGEQIRAADEGDWERAERLESEMRLKWEVR